MIKITIELPNGPNNLNEIGNITNAALIANARIHIQNDSFIPPPVTNETPAIVIPADSMPAARIEDFAHEVENGNKNTKALK